MLTIAKLGAGQENYYLAKVARGIEDYYTGEGETPGRWMGRGAERLGLAGEMSGRELRAVLAGYHPTDGEKLAIRVGPKRVPGWDLTFCAPKSVSVLYGLAGAEVAEQVVEAHHAAVTEAVHYLETHAVVTRRRVDGVVEQVRGEGLLLAGFRHRTSRAGDPHLHTHALAANLVERVSGGGWGALHSPVLYGHARTAGFVYQTILRGELTERLGVNWGPVHNGCAEIDGIDRRLAECFSKRHADIDDAVDGIGDASRRETEIAQRRTKSAKDYSVDPGTLRDRWRAEACQLGLDPDAVVAAATGDEQVLSEPDVAWAIEEMTSPRGLTARQASFDRRDVTRTWCEALPPGASTSFDTIEALTDTALADRRVVSIIDSQRRSTTRGPARPDGTCTSAAPRLRRWSTVEMLAVETELLDRAAASRNVGAGLIGVERAREALAERADMSGEQEAMVFQITTSGHGVDLVVGRAGTGKTYALAAAAGIWRRAGYQPIGLALAARAAAELETTAGITSTTVAQFLLDLDQAPGGLVNDRHVVVVDEASMVDTRRLARVLQHVEAAGGKVVLVGDHHQLPAVESGGAFAALTQRLGAVELTENRRQTHVWERDTLDRLRTGTGGRGVIGEVVAAYGERGRLHFGTTPAEVRAAMVADWYDARRAGTSVAMIALRRSDVDELNRRARSLLIADGTVAEVGLDVADRTFAAGDRVVCLHNDRRLGVHNAQFARVVDVDHDARSLTIETERNGGRLEVPWRYVVGGHLAHGYATTIHKAQGATYQRTLLLGDDRLYRQAGYTGLSRGVDRNDMYLVVDDDREHDPELARHGQVPPDEPIERLIRSLHRDGAKVLATDERQPETPACPLGSVRDLWAARDRLAGTLLAGAPSDPSSTLAILAESAADAEASLAQVSLVRAAAEERVQATGRLRRHDAAVARRDLDLAQAQEARLHHERRELDTQRNACEVDLHRWRAWADEHADDLRRLSDLEKSIEWRARLAGRAAEIDRPARVVAQLGEPPTSIESRERWRNAAAAIESYQARWDSEPDPAAGLDLTADQRAHLDAVSRHIAEVVEPPATIDVSELA